jgi:FdrA protein
MLGLQAVLSPLYSNVPIQKHQALEDPLKSKAHTIVDLGEDMFTVGRLHPMMDNDLRIRRLKQEMEDPETGVILLDVVLGEGAHPDPASELALAIEEAKRTRPEVTFLAVVVGTDEDPQNLESQISQFERVVVATISAHYRDGDELPISEPSFSLENYGEPLAAINVGLETFYESLKSQGAEVLHVDWRPPAGGNEKLMEILAKMKQ